MASAGMARVEATHRIAVATADAAVLPALEEHIVPVFHTTLLGSVKEIAPHIENAVTHAVVLDLEINGAATSAGLEVLRGLREQYADLVLVAITRAEGRVKQRAEANGADAVFTAPVDFAALQAGLLDALERREREVQSRRLREEVASKYQFCDMVGGSEAMRRVYDAVLRVAESTTPVLIRGESGTGKELVARAIVQSGPRRSQPFIAVNCAALPDNLIESELFGHEKGAFTGAHAARAGLIELADGGTLFLDEISTLGLPLQSKLLRTLQDRAVQRLGGKAVRKIDFRLITATNDDLENMVHTGRFREDLYYRIHVVPIFVPALRERKGDLAVLVDHFLRVYCEANRTAMKKVEPAVMEILEDYEWKGNVRELENLVQRMVLMAEGGVIEARHLPQQVLAHSTANSEKLLIPEEGIDFDEEMQRLEVAYLQTALGRTGGGKAAAARLLRIPPQKMKYLCRKYGL